MCGINLIYAFGSGSPADREELVRTRDTMSHRGPDSAGEWFSADGRLAMGHRRLSIIDTSHRADQPMHSLDGRYTLIFNGEIYNHRELRRELESDGERFATDSDSEVLMSMYARYGSAMLDRLRGMFAFCIWDRDTRGLFMARDPYGIKPLYYSLTRGTLRVASQVKALLAGGGVSKTVDPAGVVGFLIRGTVPQPFTTHEEISALPAGSFATLSAAGEMAIHSYFSLAEVFKAGVENSGSIAPDDWSEIVREAVAESVRYHLVSDVPLGAFLSAGKDSSTMVALAAEAGHTNLTAVTIRCAEFAGSDQDEAPLARRVADYYGVKHVVRTLDRTEFEADIPRVLAAMDQPSIDGWNSYFVSKAAGELGLKVMLSGTGGDELFGGYSTFRKIPRFVRWVRGPARVPGLARGFRSAYGVFHRTGERSSPKTASTLIHCGTYEGAYLMKRGVFLPEELSSIIRPELAEEGLRRLDLLARIRASITPDPGTPFSRVAALESSFFLRDQLLRDVDWASMAHSVEVRVPLVDAHLLRRIAPVICAARDYRKEMLAHSPRKPLPPEVMNRPKTGFLLPIKAWLRPLSRPAHPFGMRSLALTLFENITS